MTNAPSLAEQIEAVQWASEHLDEQGMPAEDWLRINAALAAAVETLRHLEFMRETLT
jgi:hypothetical protein